MEERLGEMICMPAVSMTWLCCFSLNFVNSLTRFSLCRQQLREQSAHAALSPRLRFTLGLECSGGGWGWQTRNFRSKNFNRYLFLWGHCIKVIKRERMEIFQICEAFRNYLGHGERWTDLVKQVVGSSLLDQMAQHVVSFNSREEFLHFNGKLHFLRAAYIYLLYQV